MLLELLTPTWQGTVQSGDAPETLHLLAELLSSIPEARVTLSPTEPREAASVASAPARLVAIGVPAERVIAVAETSAKRARRRTPFSGIG